MADRPASERTEEATPERLKKAREEGQIPQSQEVPSAMMMGMLLLALGMLGAGLYEWFVTQVQQGVSLSPPPPDGASELLGIFTARSASALKASAPFLLAAALASLFASFLSSGWSFAPKAVRLRFDRLSPSKGLKNLFSLQSVVRLLISLAKLAVLVVISWAYLKDKLAACYALRWATPAATISATAQMVFGLLARITMGILVIAGIDLLYQRRKHKKDLRMTKQEVKEERRQYELAPELKGRIRAIQIEMVRKRMLQEVPKADVIVTNPTHVAVALRYEPARMETPVVVAKGGDLLCEKIKEIARAHNVPIVHRPELARALYSAVEVGKAIPEVLFVAVAEVLAMIFRLRRRRKNL